jgi:vesicle coat complex subunit
MENNTPTKQTDALSVFGLEEKIYQLDHWLASEPSELRTRILSDLNAEIKALSIPSLETLDEEINDILP